MTIGFSLSSLVLDDNDCAAAMELLGGCESLTYLSIRNAGERKGSSPRAAASPSLVFLLLLSSISFPPAMLIVCFPPLALWLVRLLLFSHLDLPRLLRSSRSRRRLLPSPLPANRDGRKENSQGKHSKPPHHPLLSSISFLFLPLSPSSPPPLSFLSLRPCLTGVLLA